MHIQGIQDSSRSTPLRVDAQRNLEHVLRAAREVFGELGYGAPMEDVARRARVGVGTVYRRFPSKDVLVRRIAEEETARLTEQAQAALGHEQQPWAALSRFLRTSVASGAGRLLPPRILRTDGPGDEPGTGVGAGKGTGVGGAVAAETAVASGAGGEAGRFATGTRVPIQRQSWADGESTLRLVDGRADGRIETLGDGHMPSPPGERASSDGELRAAPHGTPGANGRGALTADGFELADDDSGAAELLDVVGQLVERARSAGELRTDVTVGDVLLVIATAAPMLPDANQQAAASNRLLDILLEGLRSRPMV
ncbi:helix-turn-helix domain-containing protein [Streptomyces sp. Z26]|uniref:TetR/AcrR family transcriptional regulator n=1 Tax=Streptomyces sp. Z26 TaxID=2500177 RepID=UPI000EF15A0F|nr:helix-turn-helix domain-containing protein [Streptomyces sp. Z26]RLL67568.1 TetR/AcrR family transcriptional regulator [Streptomyces sp. Z26]